MGEVATPRPAGTLQVSPSRLRVAGASAACLLVALASSGAAQPPPDISERANVRASVRGATHGRLTSNPPGVDCPSRCSARFPRGSTVIFTATPKAGSRFTGWGGACAGRSAWCVLVARGSIAVSARFVRGPRDDSIEEVANVFVTRPVLNVTVAPRGGGVVKASRGKISCPDRCSTGYDSKTRLELRAEAATGYRFHGWSSLLANCGRRPTCNVSMNTTTDVSATFERAGGP
ncbi:MAG TPA: hypothetical protein VFR32_09025 [Gaiellaceae bacterium]|nr:hypothetical protein [Gaiellaceae bacterium]